MKKQSTILVISLVIIGIVTFYLLKNNNHKQTQPASISSESNKTINGEIDESNKIKDFSLPDITGKEVSVMNEISKNRLTIIDFWASWCRPCMQEMPNIKALHSQYKTLGIIGVSLDEDKEQWQNTINEQDLNWVQLSDLQGWNSKAARLFEVSSIPYTLVVAQDGTIIAAGLRGESLNAFIKSRMTPQTE